MSDINNDKIIPPSDIPAQRVMMMPKDANPNGKIFGGILLSLIDVAGAIEAVRQAPNTYVTGTMREVIFKNPVDVGDVVSCWAETTAIGQKSITIKIDVFACHVNAVGKKKIHVTTAEVVYVAIDRNGRATDIYPE